MPTQKPIEPRIKGLVEIFSKVPYIKTTSSCEGHFKSPDQKKHKAYLRFEVEGFYEAELTAFMKEVLFNMKGNMWKVQGVFLRRYQLIDKMLESDYKFEIRPFGYKSDSESLPEENRRNTDLGIKIATLGVKKYLKSIGEILE